MGCGSIVNRSTTVLDVAPLAEVNTIAADVLKLDKDGAVAATSYQSTSADTLKAQYDDQPSLQRKVWWWKYGVPLDIHTDDDSKQLDSKEQDWFNKTCYLKRTLIQRILKTVNDGAGPSGYHKFVYLSIFTYEFKKDINEAEKSPDWLKQKTNTQDPVFRHIHSGLMAEYDPKVFKKKLHYFTVVKSILLHKLRKRSLSA
ncbi:hypothetical protein K469DRAFT_687254 [Zopfia rhizophila CBS 207.26]|uniref:Uncharacterized protein n=1 Tax=Zopfia rhizophila CBS 207.26 TaxID=1314779 RepID=A0A6A6E379_9PEZI|nr:hypothetical protein K469DRAFT_687254 [Zopfia rhizophila CBS 207.26]